MSLPVRSPLQQLLKNKVYDEMLSNFDDQWHHNFNRCRKRRPEMEDSGKTMQVDREVALVRTDPGCVPLGACVEQGRREKQFESQGHGFYHSICHATNARHMVVRRVLFSV